MICPIELRLFVADLVTARTFYCEDLGLFADVGWDAAHPESNCRLLWTGGESSRSVLSVHLTSSSNHSVSNRSASNHSGGSCLIKLQVENPLRLYDRLKNHRPLKENLPPIDLSDFVDAPFFHGFQLTDPFGHQFQFHSKLDD